VALDNDPSSIDTLLDIGIHVAVVFPGLKGYDGLDLQATVELIASRMYMSYIIVLADRCIRK